MAKIKYFFFFVILLPLAVYSQRGYKQDLNRIATITFPDTPKEKHIKYGPFYSVQKNDVLYSASVSHIHSNFKDDLTRHLIDSLYAAVIRGSLQRPGARLLYNKSIMIDHLKAIEYGYVSMLDSTNYYRYHRALYLNNTLITYGLSSFDSLKVDKKTLNNFFSTFKVTAPHSETSQDTIPDTLFNFKTLMWAGIALLAGVLIIFVIKKLM